MSLLGSFVLGEVIPVSGEVLEGVSLMTTFLLTAAMVGLGLNVNLSSLKTKAARPLLAMVVTSLALSVMTFFLV